MAGMLTREDTAFSSLSGSRVIRGRWSENPCHPPQCLVHTRDSFVRKVSSLVFLENAPDILRHLHVFFSEWAEAAFIVPWAWIFLLFLIRFVACPGKDSLYACIMSWRCFNEAQVLQLFPRNALCLKFKPDWTHQHVSLMNYYLRELTKPRDFSISH